MRHWQNESTDQLCTALLSLKTQEEARAFLEDICTIKEFLDLSQRLEVARLLQSGASYSAITKATGASTATISRVKRSLDYGCDSYSMVFGRMEEEK